MKTNWLKGHADKKKRKDEVLRYRPALSDLKEILERDFVKKESVRDYDQPGWAERQIAVNEYNALIDELLSLIDLKDDQA